MVELLRALICHITAVSVVGSSPTCGTCETSQDQLAGVSGGFSRGLPFSPHLLIGSSHVSCNNLERDAKLNKKNKNKHLTRAVH